jgi:hypothetical protein
MYTVVMAVLVVVMAVLWFVIDGKRKTYAQANARAEQLMTGKGMRSGGQADEPVTIPDLALAVERLSYTYDQATGGGGIDKGGRHISQEMMETVAVAAGLHQAGSSGERPTPNRARGYETVSQSFDYESMSGGPLEVWRLLTLLYNIESRGRYRVSEVGWEVAEGKDSIEPPFDKVKRSRIEVALRGPILSGD